AFPCAGALHEPLGEPGVRIEADQRGCVGDEVRQRVDVVYVGQAVERGDEVFDAADIEPAETSNAENVIHDLSGRVERVDAQLLLCGGVDDAVVKLVARVHLADVRGAEVEVPPGAICDSERVEVFATQ